MRHQAAALLLAALTPVSALAQSIPLVHDDISGTIKDQYVRKADTRYDHAGASLTFDIDYTYKASLLMGEPLTLCSAQIKNPRGSITFEYEGQSHTVSISEENARLLTPYNVDYAIAYKSINSDNIYYMARCNTGVPGSWAEDGFNVAGSPDWDDFLCWTGGSRPGLPDPMPDSLGENWCKTIGNAESRILDEAKAKEWFTRSGFSSGGTEPVMRAMSVHVASFAVDYNELVLAEIKKISSQKIAQRKFDQVEQIGGSLRKSSSRVGAQAAERLDAAIGEAKSQGDPREQARTLQEAMRDVLNIQPAADEASAFVEIRTFIISLLSSDDERSFIAGIKQDLSELQAATEQSTQAVAGIFDSHRAAGANAPAFAFTDATPAAATGPADITQEMLRIDAHNGPAYSVAFHPDGKRIISAGNDGAAIWDAQTGQKLSSLWPSEPMRIVGFSKDGKYAFGGSGGQPTRVYVRDMTGDMQEIEKVGRGDNVSFISISPDNQSFMWGERSESLSISSLVPGGSSELLIDKNASNFGTFSTEGRYAIYRQDRSIVWRDMQSGTIAGQATRDTGFYILAPATKIGILPFGELSRIPTTEATVFTVEDHWLYAFHPDGYYESTSINTRAQVAVSDFSISPDGRYALAGDIKGEVNITDLHDRTVHSRTLGRHDETTNPSLIHSNCNSQNCDLARVYGVDFSPDGTRAVSAGADGIIRIWGPAQ